MGLRFGMVLHHSATNLTCSIYDNPINHISSIQFSSYQECSEEQVRISELGR